MVELVSLRGPRRTVDAQQHVTMIGRTVSGWKATWACGFRPFFVAAPIWALVSMCIWSAHFGGLLSSSPDFVASLWHAHELIFGFAGAAIAGFLLTAGARWTQTPFVSGRRLQAIFATWLAARIGPWLPGSLPETLNLAFWLALASGLALPLWRGQNRHNRGFLAVLAALGSASYVSASGISPENADILAWARLAQTSAILLICLLIFVILGRVLPMFTRNALATSGVEFAGRSVAWTTPVGVVAAVSALAANLLAAEYSSPWLAVPYLVWAIALGWRIAAWAHRTVLRVQILAILHFGQVWLLLGLLLLAWSHLQLAMPRIAGIHALTAGAMGTLIIGFMSRVCLGHTGRELRTGSLTHLSYTAVVLSAALRLSACFWPSVGLWTASAFAWALAMILFVWQYAPMLTRPRPDGQPG